MRIAIAGSEAAPFARTGGLGDVLGALPKALAKKGHDVKLFVPCYRSINFDSLRVSRLSDKIAITVNNVNYNVEFLSIKERRLSLEIIFVKSDHFFDRKELYIDSTTGKDYSDNDERFYLFNKAILEYLKLVSWRPDIIHSHDWQTALMPALIRYRDTSDFFHKSKIVLTIHNLAYQGEFKAEQFKVLNLPEKLMYATAPFEFYGKVNFLKGGISLADKITTVSPRYAEEIQTSPELGCGMEGLLKERKEDLIGILNGVDYTVWSPSRDKKIDYNYHRANLSGKRDNKAELLKSAELPQRDGVPLVGLISRLVDQKGIDLIAEAADSIFALPLQMIVLGNGDEKYHNLLLSLQNKYPDKLRVYLKFDDKLAHQIEAGADIFLMPSRFEPCGLNQMYSLKYGTIPIVRKTGGLADTVIDFDDKTGQGTGFVFSDYSSEALLKTINRSIDLFNQRRLWLKLIKNCMACDFSWERSAERYEKLFQEINS